MHQLFLIGDKMQQISSKGDLQILANFGLMGIASRNAICKRVGSTALIDTRQVQQKAVLGRWQILLWMRKRGQGIVWDFWITSLGSQGIHKIFPQINQNLMTSLALSCPHILFAASTTSANMDRKLFIWQLLWWDFCCASGSLMLCHSLQMHHPPLLLCHYFCMHWLLATD